MFITNNLSVRKSVKKWILTITSFDYIVTKLDPMNLFLFGNIILLNYALFYVFYGIEFLN